MKQLTLRLAIFSLLVLSLQAHSAVLTFAATNFSLSTVKSEVETFAFNIDISGALVAGTSYTNPSLNSVSYSVSGDLGLTPSGFPGFALERIIGGTEFYAQGSSLAFSISALADLSDGLQVSELVAAPGLPVLVFNGREVGTGRYHPALLQLFADGTGSILNSNNFGGINPGSGEMVDVDFGDEYITNLGFNPAQLTLAGPVVVPLPAAAWLFVSALLALGTLQPRPRARNS